MHVLLTLQTMHACAADASKLEIADHCTAFAAAAVSPMIGTYTKGLICKISPDLKLE